MLLMDDAVSTQHFFVHHNALMFQRFYINYSVVLKDKLMQLYLRSKNDFIPQNFLKARCSL